VARFRAVWTGRSGGVTVQRQGFPGSEGLEAARLEGGSRLGLGVVVAVAVWLRRHRQRVRRSRRMRHTPVTTERTRSDGIMNPSNQVIEGLILPQVESR
jgi:hypothetical protein